LDDTKDPKQIDMYSREPGGRTVHGIYAIENDQLKLCLPLFGDLRPTAFVSEPGSDHDLKVWRRAPLAS
jgi:uncharacterized protein (TIGR03067 family)